LLDVPLLPVDIVRLRPEVDRRVLPQVRRVLCIIVAAAKTSVNSTWTQFVLDTPSHSSRRYTPYLWLGD